MGGDTLENRKKPGPKPENPLDGVVRIRIDKITLKKLDKTAKKMRTSRSDIIRKGIDKMYDDLDTKN